MKKIEPGLLHVVLRLQGAVVDDQEDKIATLLIGPVPRLAFKVQVPEHQFKWQ
jgi:hypothetical protein